MDVMNCIDAIDCIALYEEKLKRELQRKDLIVINLERVLESIEKSIADIKGKKEMTPYASVSEGCDSALGALSEEKKRIEKRIEEYLHSIAPSSITLIGYRILAKMLAHAGSFRALAFMPASRLQIIGAEKGFFSENRETENKDTENKETEYRDKEREKRTPKHGYIFQHPLIKGVNKKEGGKSARKLACSLAIALRKDYFSLENIYADETLKASRARTNERSKLFYLFNTQPELLDSFKGRVLYLGAGSGTTAKRLAKISQTLFCVELSPFPFASLLEVARREQKKNIYPILEDANNPKNYASIVSAPEMLYQDITQRNQVEIFLKNLSFFSIKRGVMMLKASSVDSKKPANRVFDECREELLKEGYNVRVIDLRAEFKNHAALLVEKI